MGTPRIGQNIRRLRVARGLTQAQLAEAAEAAPETISRIERGHLDPAGGLIARIADALAVSVSELASATPPVPRPSKRPGIARLIALAEPLNDTQLDALVRSVGAIIEVGRQLGPRRTARPRRTPT